MTDTWLYSLGSVFLVSLVSLIGIFTISIKLENLKKILIYLVSFSAGALLGGAFIHLIPEITESMGFGMEVSMAILLGILFSFVLEKVVRWRHCHDPDCSEHRSLAYMNLVGDAVHNFMDGIIIAAAYLVSIPVGIATTIAVLFHEIPQEIGDFGVLLYAGFSKKKVLLFNFLSALTAVLGALMMLLLSTVVEGAVSFLVPFAAGMFIYIAGSDLIPELHKEREPKKSVFQFIAFVLGILVMASLMFLE